MSQQAGQLARTLSGRPLAGSAAGEDIEEMYGAKPDRMLGGLAARE